MLLTHERLQSIVHEELGRGPARSTYEQLINEAGEAWVNAHEWRYLRDRSQEIAAVAGVEEYAMGLGVRAVTALHRPDTVWPSIPIISFDGFERMRQQYLSRIERIQRPIANVRYDAREDDKAPRLYLSIYPVDFTERLVAQYNAGWLPLDGLQDVADIPPPLGTAFTEWLRGYADYQEYRSQRPPDTLDRMRAAHSFRAAKSVDGQASGPIAKQEGGAGAYYNRSRARRALGGVWTPHEIRRFQPDPE